MEFDNFFMSQVEHMIFIKHAIYTTISLITVINVLLHLTMKFLKSFIQGVKIGKYRTQHQCITFAPDTEQNNVGTFQVIPKDQKTLPP